jgi:hypothetical protein
MKTMIARWVALPFLRCWYRQYVLSIIDLLGLHGVRARLRTAAVLELHCAGT